MSMSMSMSTLSMSMKTRKSRHFLTIPNSFLGIQTRHLELAARRNVNFFASLRIYQLPKHSLLKFDWLRDDRICCDGRNRRKLRGRERDEEEKRQRERGKGQTRKKENKSAGTLETRNSMRLFSGK